MSIRTTRALSVLGIIAVAACVTARPAAAATDTPPELVAAYDSLADILLAGKKTEFELVRSILATTYGHAEAAMARIRAGGPDAGKAVETLAALVAQIGNEGDASVAAIRKRLVEGGHHHHHHADDSDDGDYDEGFVIVTRAAKKAFLDASRAIGKLASSHDAGAVEAQWSKVAEQYRALLEAAKP